MSYFIIKFSSIALVFLLYSCAKSEKNIDNRNHETIDFTRISRKEDLKLSTITNELNYITLETDSNAIIGEVNKIIFAGDKIFILDRFIAKKAFIFVRRTIFRGSR